MDKRFSSEMSGTEAAAARFGVSKSTVQRWCREGKIDGAVQDAPFHPWHIPGDAQDPRSRKK